MPAPRFGRDKEKFRQPFQRLRLVRRSLTALPGAAEKEKQGSARTALVPGGHRSALTEPAGETAQRIERGPGAEAPCFEPPLSITTKRTPRLLAWMSFFLFQNEGQGAAHRGGHTSPLFWSMGRQGRWCPVGTVQRRSTLPLRSVLGVCHWQTAPEPAGEICAPCNPETLGRRPKPRSF